MEFTPKEFEKFREDVTLALQSVMKKYALNMTAGHISYREDTFTLKVECAKADAGDIKKREFEKNCTLFGLSPGDYMREFTANGDKYALVDLSLESPKYPFICLNLRTKKTYKFTAEVIKEAFGK